jgi:uncharacterized protein (TIGR02594 family)
MPLISVENDPDTAGYGEIHATQTTVSINNKPVIVIGNLASPDSHCPDDFIHCVPLSVQGSPNVFVGGIAVHRDKDLRICGDLNMVLGQFTVFANEGGGSSSSPATANTNPPPPTSTFVGNSPEQKVTITHHQQQTYNHNLNNTSKYNTPANIENGVAGHPEMEDDPSAPPVQPVAAAISNPNCSSGGDLGTALDNVLAEAKTGQWTETGNNPNINALYGDVGFPDISGDKTAWCAAFTGAMLKRNCFKFNQSLAAGSYTGYGNPVSGGISNAQKGDIVVFNRDGGTGHVAMYYGPGPRPGTIYVVGGNQGRAGSVTKSLRKVIDIKVDGVQRPIPS